MTLNIHSEIPGIPLLVYPQESSCPGTESGHSSQQVWQHNSPKYFPAFPLRQNHSMSSHTPQCIPWQLQESPVWRYSIALPGPQGWWALQTKWRLSLHTVVTSWRLSGLNMKPLISRKELSSLKNPAVLEDPPMVNLLCYSSSITIRSSGAALVSDTKNPQFPAFWILQDSEEKGCYHSW